MSDIIKLKHLLNNKNLGVPNYFYCSNYENVKHNNSEINNINKNNIIDDNNYNKLLELNLSKKIKQKTKKKTKKKVNKNKNKITKKK